MTRTELHTPVADATIAAPADVDAAARAYWVARAGGVSVVRPWATEAASVARAVRSAEAAEACLHGVYGPCVDCRGVRPSATAAAPAPSRDGDRKPVARVLSVGAPIARPALPGAVERGMLTGRAEGSSVRAYRSRTGRDWAGFRPTVPAVAETATHRAVPAEGTGAVPATLRDVRVWGPFDRAGAEAARAIVDAATAVHTYATEADYTPTPGAVVLSADGSAAGHVPSERVAPAARLDRAARGRDNGVCAACGAVRDAGQHDADNGGDVARYLRPRQARRFRADIAARSVVVSVPR